MRAGARPFVGREAELSRLLGALEDAAGGVGAVVLVSGDAGIGKTRLVEELAAQAVADGMTVCWGRCWEAGGAPPFWPWIEVLRTLPGAPVELLTAAAELESPTAERARFERFDAVARFLAAAAAAQPALVVLDDVHAADPSSLLLLELLTRTVRTARVLVVAAYRPAEVTSGGGAEVVARLRRAAVGVELLGLTDAEIAQLVLERTGTPPGPSRLDELSMTTNGNPFLVGELADLAPGEPLPEGVRQTVDQRLRPLLPPVRELLGIAAVGGRDIDPPVLARVAARPELDVVAQLDAAERAGVLTRGGTGDALRFRHVLMRDVLEDGLDPETRRRLHVAFADALAVRHALDPSGQLAAIARHRRAALPVGARADALHATLRAARRCDIILAHEAAAEEYERAWHLVDEERSAADVLLALGAARHRAGRAEPARVAFDGAAELARRLGDPERFALATLGATEKQAFQRNDPGRPAALADALAMLGDRSPLLRARLLAALTRALVYSGAAQRATTVGAEAVALARQVGDDRVLADALHAQQVGAWRPDTVDARLSAADEVVELATASGDVERALDGQMWRLIAQVQRCDIGGVDRAVHGYTLLAERSRQPRHRFVALSRQAMRAFLVGAYDEGTRLAAQAREVGLAAGEPDAEIVQHGLRALPCLAAGDDVTELEEAFRAFSAEHTSAGSRCLLARFALARDAPAEAQAALDAFAGPDHRFAAIPVDMDWLLCLCLLAEVAARLADRDGCAALYPLLAPFAGHGAQVAGAVSFAGATDLYLGMLTGALGRRADAERHLAAARHIHAAMGARPWVARTALEQARLGLVPVSEAATLVTGPGLAGLARELDALAAGAPPDPPAPPRTAVLRRSGRVWTVGYSGAVFELPDTRGLQHLARLLAAPGREMHVLDLTGRLGGDAGPVLDAAAKAAYRTRVAELRAEIDDARAGADAGRAERAEIELDALTDELAAAVGIGGRDRLAVSTAERARVAARKAIGAALRRIAERDADLGRLLCTTVRTGTYCSYTPDPRWPVRWEL